MADNTFTIKFDTDTTLKLLEGLKGPKGEKGEDGQRGERGEEGKQGSRGPKGEDGSAEKSAQFLKENGIWLEDTSVDTVLLKVIKLSNCHNNFIPKDLNFVQPKDGATYIDFTGEPHFKLSINNGEKRVFESDNMRVAIDSTMKGTIIVSYYNLVDELVSTQQITLKEANGDISYDMGALSSIEELTGHEDNFTELAGKVAIYKKGVKFTPTALSVKDTDNNRSAMALGMLLEEFNPTSGMEYYEIDLSKLPSNNTALPNEVPVNIVRYYRNVIIKVRKANVIGNSETIKLRGEDYQSIKINGSDLVETHRGSNYTYSFATDTITAD
jgi:hypothetical protein|nr:MAG TPA: nucleoid-associated protein [Caudoviricetes sp.]